MVSPGFREFWTERRLCVVTTLRPDLSPHSVPMGVVVDFDTHTGWAITNGGSRKARNLTAAGDEGGRISVCQVDGRHWSTIEGRASVLTGTEEVAEAARRYAQRYRQPRPNAQRVGLRIAIDRVLGNVS